MTIIFSSRHVDAVRRVFPKAELTLSEGLGYAFHPGLLELKLTVGGCHVTQRIDASRVSSYHADHMVYDLLSGMVRDMASALMRG